ncbi:glutamyl-tRNA reductase [Anaerostipes sp.]|uniref:glutamyl-tRNA reductase n=1 Tax=Anaerostipes sp. TaxID=1872530 RepID=UPI0025C4012B|nr:glutamyl-tRNA reductase [Anaerostipes sp.]MBS7007404.1 glutamyl-tRNA reductase [Anaerostipes sp.]
MKLSMIGIDYHTASVDEREPFAFTDSGAVRFMQSVKEADPEASCIVLSTCNRTELWFYHLDRDPLDYLFSQLSITEDSKRSLFVCREDEEAVFYLMELASGIHSQILGEDQIISQVRDALERARECCKPDPVLDTLFRMAVTAAKKVKTDTRIGSRDTSVPERAVSILEERYGSFREKQCLVIGNGEMGRLLASWLVHKKAQVSMTLRQYRKQDVLIPAGCGVIPYKARYEAMGSMDFIFSATRSPHYTVQAQQAAEVFQKQRSYVFADLAVPRDLDPKLAQLPGCRLLSMDDLGIQTSVNGEEMKKAREILREQTGEFINWYYFRSYIPLVRAVGSAAADLTSAKLKKSYKKLRKEGADVCALKQEVERASSSAVERILFGLKDILPREEWQQVLKSLEASAEEVSIY